MSKLQKFVALFDLHVGFERGLERGEWKVQAAHAAKAIKCTLNFINDFEPDVLILGGDQLHMGPISHWTKGRPIFTENMSLKADMELLYSTVLEPIAHVKRKVWHDGNHEQWAHDYVSENTGIRGLIEPHQYLQLENIGYEVYGRGEISRIGKLYFVHGDIALGKGGGQNPAKTLVNYYRRNIRCGHLHTFNAAIDNNPVDTKDFHSGVVVPSLSSRNPYWLKNAANQFMQGFLYGYVDKEHFNDYVVIITNNEFIANGKHYR